MTALPILSLVLASASVQPGGTGDEVAWPRGEQGRAIGGDGATFEITGPGAVTFEIRGTRRHKKGTFDITVTRDGTHVSKNSVGLSRMGRGPTGYGVATRLAVEVPAGKHTYVISSSTEGMAAIARATSSYQSRFAAAAEAAISGATPAASASADVAPAAPEPEAAAHSPDDTAKLSDIMDSSEKAAETAAAGFQGNNVRKALRIAVYDFEIQAIDPKVGAVVTDSVLSEVRKLQGISAIGMDEIRDMLSHEVNKQMLGCEDSTECMAEIAGALGVDQLVTGRLTKVDEQHVVVVRRIDQNRAKVLDTFEQRLKAGSGEEFLAAVGPAIEKLFSDYELRDGTERGVPKEMALRLDPPPIPTWGFYSAAGAALASAALASGLGVLTLNARNDYESKVASGTEQNPVPGAEVVELEDKFNSRKTLTNAFWISTGVFAVAAGVMAFFTDWEGYQESADKLQEN